MKNILYFITISVLLLPNKVFAADSSNDIVLPKPGSDLNLTKWQNLEQVLKAVPNILIGLAGAVFLFVLAIGGYIYLTATGDEKKESQAKMIFIYGAIGLVVILGGYAILIYFMNKFGITT